MSPPQRAVAASFEDASIVVPSTRQASEHPVPCRIGLWALRSPVAADLLQKGLHALRTRLDADFTGRPGTDGELLVVDVSHLALSATQAAGLAASRIQTSPAQPYRLRFCLFLSAEGPYLFVAHNRSDAAVGRLISHLGSAYGHLIQELSPHLPITDAADSPAVPEVVDPSEDHVVLPADAPRGNQGPFLQARVTLPVSEGDAPITFFDGLTAFLVFLYRTAHRSGLVVDVPLTPEDPDRGMARMCLHLSPMTFAELNAAVRRAHSKLQASTRPASAAPCYGYQPRDMFDATTTGPFLRRVTQWPHTAFTDVAFSLEAQAVGFSMHLDYATARFAPDTAWGMIRRLQGLLTVACTRPKTPIHLAPVCDAAETRHLAALARQAMGATPPFRSVYSLVAEAARRTPGAPAVRFGTRTLTYQGFWETVCRAQARLAALGIGLGHRVAVCLLREPETPAVWLAVLARGAAVVPLDVEDPAAHRRRVTELTRPDLVLCAPGMATGDDRAVDWTLPRDPVSPPPAPPELPTLPAFVIVRGIASGSTRAVGLSHRNLAAIFHQAAEIYTTGDMTAVTAASPLRSAHTLFETLTVLSRGGEVVLLSRLSDLAEDPHRDRVTMVHGLPAAVADLLDRGPLPTGVTCVNLTGERFPMRLVHRLYAQPGIRTVYNLYGSLESAGYAFANLLPRGIRGPAFLGRPTCRIEARLTDAMGQPTPRAVPGELLLGGDGTAMGFLGRPAETAACFVPHPFTDQMGARLYKTGDLAHWRRDGRLKLLCPLKDRLRIRGVLVQQGEMEAALETLPGVRRARMFRSHSDGEMRPTAYLEVRPDRPAPTADMQARVLAPVLPPDTGPLSYVVSPGFPRTHRGKIDRQRLTSPPTDPPRPRAPAPCDGHWVRPTPLQTRGTHGTLYLVHAAGGNLYSYAAFAQALKTHAVYGFEAPGLRGNSTPLTSIEALSQVYTEALLRMQPRGPYQLGAWSVGGVVVFDMIRRLRAHGHEVATPLLFDSWAPIPENMPHHPDDATLVCMYVADLTQARGALVELSWQALSQLSPAARCDHAYAAARAGGMRDLRADEFARGLEVYQTNVRAVLAYRATPQDGAAVLFRAQEEQRQTPGAAHTLGWDRLYRRGVTRHLVAGNHFNLFRPDRLPDLVAAVTDHLHKGDG